MSDTASASGLWRDEPPWLRVAASPHVFVFACAWLLLLTALGTLAQADLGLWRAEDRYFSSWFLWAFGWLPLPGGRLTLTVTGLNLLAMLFTRRGTRSQGLFLLHAGTLLLLGGALVGGALRREGSLALAEGEVGDEMRSWRRHELAVLVEGVGSEDRLVSFGEGLLKPGAVLAHPELPFPLTIAEHHRNCRDRADGGLDPRPLEREGERDQAGAVLVLPDGRRVAVRENQDALAELTQAGGPRTAATMRRATTQLPFAIRLKRFIRSNHPGTVMAREYSSEVVVLQDGAAREVTITMNRPLRIGAWTFYQQSFVDLPEGPISVLAVVHDRFQLSPYLASAVMLLGLLVHMFERWLKRGRG